MVDRCKPLDLNSRYCYMLICTHFHETSLVAEADGAIVGLVSAYMHPKQSDTLFVWQVAVDASVRGRGVASRMFSQLLTQENMQRIRYIETTVSPSNIASQNLFKRLAGKLKTKITDVPYFDRDLFGGEAHEDEYLFKLGPISHTLPKGE